MIVSISNLGYLTKVSNQNLLLVTDQNSIRHNQNPTNSY